MKAYFDNKRLFADDLTLLGLAKLDNRFAKIDPNEYYLSYSGGKDSELVRRYIEYMKLPIKIVSLNTYREHNDIRRRMYKHADIVLYPTKSFKWINENYGMPCFSKQQDEYIKRYQKGNRSPNTMKAINGGEGSKFQLNKKAKTLTLSNELHKVSGECCKYTKKEPLRLYGKKNKLKAIICVRGDESIMRKAKYTTCLSVDGTFTPIHDFPKEIVDALNKFFEIKNPKVYDVINRTGCIGCPYGKRNTERELFICTPSQRAFAIKSFKKSYDVLGVDYLNEQTTLF